MNLARLGSKVLADNEPWKTGDRSQRVETILRPLRITAALAASDGTLLPFTSQRSCLAC